MRRTTTFFALSLLLGFGSRSPEPRSADDAPTHEVGENTILLDVRTPAEYAAGHVEGSRLIDFNSGDVAAAIPSLDPNAEYLLYCRSGNRSGQAAMLMQRAGFTNLTNLGSLEEAAEATKLPIVV